MPRRYRRSILKNIVAFSGGQIIISRNALAKFNPETLEPWNGQIFTASSGVNVVPLGFEVYAPVSVENWDAIITDAKLTTLLAAGFDHVRIAFDPTPCLRASNEEALINSLNVAQHAVDTVLKRGLKVILDLHVATTGDWSTTKIEAAFKNGPEWLRYLEIAKHFGTLCARYPTAKVALEVYNENSNNETFGNQQWAQRAKAIWNAIRTVNKKTTLLVGGSFYCGIDGLLDLQAKDFDQNTGFVIHNYEPNIFTHQNAANYAMYVERLHYPPVPSQRSSIILGTRSRIEASTLGVDEKASAVRDRTERINVYLNTPQNGDFLDRRIGVILAWCRRNRVEPKRIFVTEFGVHNDRDARGASPIARAAWLQDVDVRHEVANFCRTVWNFNSPDHWDLTTEDGSWTLRNSYLTALGRQSIQSYQPEALQFFDRMGESLERKRKELINTTITMLKEAGLWEKIDVLYFLAADTPNQARLNWKNMSHSLPLSQQQFIRNRGFARTSGAVEEFETGFMPGSGLLRHGDGHVGLYLRNTQLPATTSIGTRAWSVRLSSARVGSSSFSYGNGNLLVDQSSRNGDEHLIASWLMGAESTLYWNANPLRSAHETSWLEARTEESSIKVRTGASSTPGPAAVHLGASLNASEACDLFTILRFYLIGMQR